MDRTILMKGKLENNRHITYFPPPNLNYSIFFEVFTMTGAVNVSHDTFSKI